MNLILVDEADYQTEKTVLLTDRRLEHIAKIHRAKLGDSLRVGRIGGKIGTGLITHLSEARVELELDLQEDPPAPAPLTLFLALPRPKFLAKVVQTATTFGIKKIYLFNSYRVDKVYWHCEQITPQSLKESCILGLEQARDTTLPEIHLRKLFKPFVEDELPSLIKGTKALLAHPIAARECPYAMKEPVSVAVGPEGGFIEYEVKKLEEAGFETVTLYPRILKVETAIAALAGRLL